MKYLILPLLIGQSLLIAIAPIHPWVMGGTIALLAIEVTFVGIALISEVDAGVDARSILLCLLAVCFTLIIGG